MDEIFSFLNEKISTLLLNQKCELLDAAAFPEEARPFAENMNKLITDLEEIRKVVLELSEGNVFCTIPSRRNYLAAPVKQLQSQLSILEWNAQQLAAGKIASKLDGQGGLFQAFNAIIDFILKLSSCQSENREVDAQMTALSSWRYHQILLALNKIKALLIETDASGKIVYANHAANTFFGTVGQIDIPNTENADHELLSYLASYRKKPKGKSEYRELYDQKRKQWFKITSDQFSLAEDKIFYVYLIENITDWKRQEEELKISANYDSMTGFYNLRAGLSMMQQELDLSDAKTCHSLIFVDLDDLKSVNDNYGHKEGDFFIKVVSQLLVSSVRHSDMVTRYGGDEFVIFFKGCNGQAAKERMEAISSQLALLNQQCQKAYQMGFSHGIHAFCCDSEMKIKDLIVLADQEMYQNKKQKRKETLLPLQ